MRAVTVRASLSFAIVGALSACGPGNNANNGSQKGGGVSIVALSGTVGSMEISTVTIGAGFGDRSSTSSVACTQRTQGACTINECMTTATDGGAAPQDAGMNNGARSAGVITISGGGQMIQLMPNADNTYPSINRQMQVFAPGTMLTVSAAGDPMGVPAFTGTLTMPSPVMVTAPMIRPTSPTMISRSQALVASWTGGTTGKVSVNLVSAQATNTVTVTCMFDAAAGMGTVPAEVMALLPPGTGSIAIGASDTREQMAGDYKVTLSANGLGLIGGLGQAMFQ